MFEARELLEWMASTWTTLGYALWLEGHNDEALAACQRAEALHRQLGELDFLPGVLALLALIHLGAGDPASALACTQQALQTAMLGNALSEVFPEVYYAHAN